MDCSDAIAALAAISWDVAVFDEAHELKNDETRRSDRCRILRTAHRVLLTGTPVQNNINELVNLVTFSAGEFFVAAERASDGGVRWLGGRRARLGDDDDDDTNDDEDDGENSYSMSMRAALVTVIEEDLVKHQSKKKRSRASAAALGGSEEELPSASALASILSAFVLRRTKQGVEGLDLPPKTRHLVWLSAEAQQQRLVDELNLVTLKLAAADSILAGAVLKALPDAHQLRTAGAAHATAENQIRPFIGDLAGVIGSGYGSKGAAPPSPEAPGGALGKLLCLLRKSAIHPLLVRSHYSNAACLAMARATHSHLAPSDGDSLSKPFSPATPALPFRDILAWAKGDSKLARHASSLLAASDFELMTLAYSEGALTTSAAARAAWRKYQLPATALGGGAKMDWLRTALASAAQRGSRIALFSQFTSVLDIIETALAKPGLMSEGVTRTCRLDGSTPVTERQRQLDTFENDKTILVMLLSTRAGGVGINLTSADTVVIFDCDWNPQNDVQAEDRCYRLGQTRPVNVYRLLVRGTIEVHLSSIAEGKRGIADSLLELSEI